MKYVLQFFISLVIFSLSCSGGHHDKTITEIGPNDVKYRTVFFEKVFSFDGDSSDYSFIDIVASKNGQFFGFDQNSGSIVKIVNDSVVNQTGGIGDGPNEYDVEAKPSLLICDENNLIAFELKAARYQVYDIDLNYISSVLLDAIPEEIVCYSQDEIAVFYHIKEGIDIMHFDGSLTRSLKFVEDWPGNNLTFKEAIYTNNNFFISYTFDPRLAIYKVGYGMSDLISLPVINRDSVKFATKNISKSSNNIHLYFYDDHISTPKAKRKKGHVFSDSGEYLYSYHVPSSVNYYKFFSEDKLVAVEDTLQRIVIYNFMINE
ncbi:hypothetical protein [Gracilimonas sp.]|uniref:hypothetical protein n=1 Tax=Gracilimonas sp. TaxID=1974203 RepID=UPI003BA9BAA0